MAANTKKKAGRRGRQPGWGTVAELPSGRFIARWSDTDGRRCQAEQTFASITDARAFLATVKADLLRKTYRLDATR